MWGGPCLEERALCCVSVVCLPVVSDAEDEVDLAVDLGQL